MSLRQSFADLTRAEQAEREEFSHPTPRVRMLNKMGRTWGQSGDYRDLQFTDEYNEPGSFSITLPADDYYNEYFYGQHVDTTRMFVVDLPGYRTAWHITDFKRKRQGFKRVIEANGVGMLQHLAAVRLWPNPEFPAEFQPLHYWPAIGPAITNMSAALMANFIRLQAPLYSIPVGNVMDLATWNLIQNAFDPFIINPRNKLLADTSKWITATWRMDEALAAFKDICDVEGIQLTADYFDPDTDEQPFPEIMVLDKPKIIFDFVEKGKPQGFTGTVIDGFIRTGVDLADDALGWFTYPILGEGERPIASALGLTEDTPIACYTTGQWSPVPNFEQVGHTPTASRVTAGGHSPDWVNALVVTGVNAAIGALGTAIGIPGLQLGAAESLVKDTIFAFHSAEDLGRANRAGPFRLREAFAESSQTGLSLETLSGMHGAHYASRGYVSHAIEVSNGSPYWIGRDLRKGDHLGVVMPDGKAVEVDRLQQINFEDSRDARSKYVLGVSSLAAEREPGSMALAKFRQTATWLNRVAVGTGI